MLLFSEKNTAIDTAIYTAIDTDITMYIFIHIPKNSGRYIREQIVNKFITYNCSGGISYLDDIDKQYLPHSKYKTIKNFYSNNYKFITFIRNPYDRCISSHFFRNKMNSTIDALKNFIKTELENYIKLYELSMLFIPQFTYIINEDGNIPDDITIYKLEDYGQETQSDHFFQFENFQLKKYDYSVYLDYECIEIINKIYEKDFAMFNYKIITNTNILNTT